MRKEEGDVIGLPLYILIAVVVAAVALAAILSFMVTSGPTISDWNIQPKQINATTDDVTGQAKWSGYVNITVYDQNGHPLSNVNVLLEGCGITMGGTTNAHGMVSLYLKNVTLPKNVQADKIKVTMSYPGLIGEQTKTDNILVIRSA